MVELLNNNPIKSWVEIEFALSNVALDKVIWIPQNFCELNRNTNPLARNVFRNLG